MTGEFGVKFFSQRHYGASRRNAQGRDTNDAGSRRQRPDDSVLVVRLLDDRLQRARDANAVTAHHRRVLFSRFVQKQCVQFLAVFGAELEDVADFDRTADLERFPTADAGLARPCSTQVGPVGHTNVAADRYIGVVETILIGAGGHTGSVSEDGIRVDGDLRYMSGAETSRVRPKLGKNFFCRGRLKVGGAEDSDQLGFVELIISPNQDQRQLALDAIDQSLDLLLAVTLYGGWVRASIVTTPGVGNF